MSIRDTSSTFKDDTRAMRHAPTFFPLGSVLPLTVEGHYLMAKGIFYNKASVILGGNRLCTGQNYDSPCGGLRWKLNVNR
jgi:hypothetical protein